MVKKVLVNATYGKAYSQVDYPELKDELLYKFIHRVY